MKTFSFNSPKCLQQGRVVHRHLYNLFYICLDRLIYHLPFAKEIWMAKIKHERKKVAADQTSLQSHHGDNSKLKLKKHKTFSNWLFFMTKGIINIFDRNVYEYGQYQSINKLEYSKVPVNSILYWEVIVALFVLPLLLTQTVIVSSCNSVLELSLYTRLASNSALTVQFLKSDGP